MSAKSIYPTPARYKVLADAYIGNVHYVASTAEAQVFVEYDGHPGSALEPVDDEGHQRQAAYFASRHTTAEAAAAEKRRLTQGAFDPAGLVPASDSIH